jgi:hypothetical protein
MMTEAEAQVFRDALAQDGWYGCFRTPEGIRHVPVVRFEVIAEDDESELVAIKPIFRFVLADEPFDVMGGFTILDIFHPDLRPEPEEFAWTL